MRRRIPILHRRRYRRALRSRQLYGGGPERLRLGGVSRKTLQWALVGCALFIGGVLADAQLPTAPAPQPATVTGDVVDSHDGLVPGAHIVATEVGLTRKSPQAAPAPAHETTSDSAGHFEIAGLAPGVWSVAVTAPMLKTFVAPHVVLKSGQRFALEGIILPVAEQHADVTVTVTMRQLAEDEIHDQEKQRVIAIFPNYGTSYVWNAAPLDAKQKLRLSARATFDPVSFFTAAANAGVQQIRNTYPSYGSGAEGYGKRYAGAWGTVFIGHNLSYGVFPSVFRQDPRYFYMGTGGVKRRAIHAIASSILCRGDNGHTQFNASFIAGDFSAGLISHTYRPDSTGGLRLATDNTLIGIAGTAGVNVLREFFLKHFSTGTPGYGKGKPAAEATKATAQ
jgi:hypothetical protein